MRIEFNSPVQTLEIKTNNGYCECLQEDDEKVWTVKFVDLIEGEIALEIIADNKVLLPKKDMIVESRGLKTNNMGLGGLP